MPNRRGPLAERSAHQDLRFSAAESPNRSGLGSVLRNPQRLEQYAIRFALVIYVLFQVNAALHHGSWGQDFESHKSWMTQAVADPWKFALSADPTRPEPPLAYLMAALVVKLTGGVHYLEVIALLDVALNVIGLIVFYRLLRLVVQDRLIRIACFLFVAFLPVFMIHEVVLATDALCVPIAAVIYYFLIKVGRERNEALIASYLAVISCALLIGTVIKFTFVSQGFAVLIALAIYVWTHRLRKEQITKGFVVIALLTCLGAALVLRSRASIEFTSTTGAEMALSDMLLLHRHDPHILSAPPYDQLADLRDGTPVSFPYELLRQHRYSYAALVHLGLFTDIMNIYQYDPTDNYFGPRSRSNEKRMRIAVKTSLLFSLAGLALTAIMIAKAFYGSIIQRRSEYAEWAALAICGLGWFLNIFVFLPTVQAYVGGYWSPRLILPALLCFTMLCAITIDRLIVNKPKAWGQAILAVVVFQSLLQLSFLWPWGLLQGQTIQGYPQTFYRRPPAAWLDKAKPARKQ